MRLIATLPLIVLLFWLRYFIGGLSTKLALGTPKTKYIGSETRFPPQYILLSSVIFKHFNQLLWNFIISYSFERLLFLNYYIVFEPRVKQTGRLTLRMLDLKMIMQQRSDLEGIHFENLTDPNLDHRGLG